MNARRTWLGIKSANHRIKSDAPQEVDRWLGDDAVVVDRLSGFRLMAATDGPEWWAGTS